MGTAPHYSWVEATHVSVNTLTPKSSRRVLAPRPSRWQQGALPLSYYCLEAPAGVSPASPGLQPGTCILGHGARAAEEGLEPPTTVVNGHPLSRLSYSAKARTGSRHAPGGSHAGFPCGLSTAGPCLQDGPGCATPAAGDPYRTRTCVRCLRGSRPTARRTGRELVRKVEVSNPHGRTVSLFSKQGAPSQRGIPSRAEGQRIERWRGCPRPSLSKRAPSHSVNPPDASRRQLFSRQRPRLDSKRASFGLGGRCASSRATGAMKTETISVREPPPGPDPRISAVPRLRSFH